MYPYASTELSIADSLVRRVRFSRAAGGFGEDPHPLVYRHAVSLPIILSAPHGGKLAIPGVPVRTGEGQVKAAGKFVASRDTGTEELAQAVSEAIECATSKLARSCLIAKQSTTFFLLDRNIQQ